MVEFNISWIHFLTVNHALYTYTQALENDEQVSILLPRVLVSRMMQVFVVFLGMAYNMKLFAHFIRFIL